MKRLTWSLKTKMIFGVCLIVAGLTSVLAYTTLSYFQQQLRENVAAQQFVLVSALAGNLDDSLTAAQDELLKLAALVPPGLLQHPGEAQDFLQSESEHKITFDNGLALLSREGALIAQTPFAPERQTKNFAFRDYLRKTVASGQPVISAPFFSSQKHRHPVVAFTAPLLDSKGKLVGVLVGGLDLTRHNFLGKIAHTRLGTSGYLYLFDTDRTMIMHPDEARILARDIPPGANRGLDRALAGFEGTLETVNSRGVAVLASFKRLRRTGWILGANFPQAEAYAGIKKSRRFLDAALPVAIALCVAGVWFFMEHLTAPLQRLAAHVRSLTGKRGPERLFADDDADEIALLAEAFNDMVRELDAEREALKESEERLRQIAEHCEEVLFIVSSDLTRMIYINPAYQKLWQLSCQSVYQRPDSFTDLIHREDRPRVLRALERLAAGVAFEETYRIVRPDGSERWILARTYPVGVEDGEIYRYVGIAEDVTGRMLDEARIRKMELAVEQSPVSIVITDCAGSIEYVNPKFTQLTGYAPAEVLGRNSRILQTGQTPAELYRQLWKSISSGAEWHGEILNRKKNGESFWESVSISPIKDSRGAITHYLAVKEDVTARRMLEEELRGARNAAQAADRLKSEFLANVSHEIRTPMNGVIGMTDLLRETALTGEQSEYLQALTASAESLLIVIGDILDFSRIEDCKLELARENFGLRASLEQSLSALARTASSKGLLLAIRIPPEVPDALVGDRGRLMQVLVNLVSNAIKFTESGEVALLVRAGTAPDPAAVRLSFTVSDTGIGISTEMQCRVFDPFSQADASATRRFGGNGLGLTIAARLVGMMGGALRVESEPQQGSSFFFTLPFGLQQGLPVRPPPREPPLAGVPRGPGATEGRAEPFDTRETLARMDGDWDLFREVVGIFAADSHTMMALIGDAIEQQDPAGLNRAAHTLKGALSNFGARAPLALVHKLETLGKKGNLDGAAENFALLETELERLREALDRYAGRMGT